MFTQLRRLLELIRFSHTLFALPFALLAALLAWQDEPFRWLDLVGILLCMVFARSAAMAFNRLADRDIDAKNPRTAKRHLPAGLLRVGTVIAFTLVCCSGFIASTLLFLEREPSNPWPLYLSVPVLLFVLGYSLTKRFTSLAHFWLGAALMLSPVATWIAVKGLTDMTVPLLLGAAVMFWVAGFDILYACQDAAFDASRGAREFADRGGVPRGDVRLARGVVLRLAAFGKRVPGGARRGRRVIDLRTCPGASRRFKSREPGVLPRQRRHQRGVTGAGGCAVDGEVKALLARRASEVQLCLAGASG